MSASPATYRLGAELGRGALGRVLRLHRDGERDRAGKILHASHQADPKAQSRFEGEAEILTRLRHDNVVAVHGLEHIDGERVLVMELVDGAPLSRAILIDAPFPEARIAALGAGIAKGLAAAHHAGLVHRDLKPDNVLLTSDDVPKLVDFGLARATSFAGVDPSAFAVVGTPDYMAPETLDPLAVDARSDLYSLGCILYEMAAGAPPFSGATAFAVLDAHKNAPVPALATDDHRSQELVSLITALLSKSPADRPQSAVAVVEALARLSSDASTGLARTTGYSVVHAGQCAACGEPAVAGVSVCFGCGLAQVALEAGDCTVCVTGPGNVTDKLDATLRERLVEWIGANPALGLDAKWLTKHAPRLPFVVTTQISERSARTLVVSLERLGLKAESVVGGRFKLPAIREKAWQLSKRMAIIGGTSIVGVWHTLGIALIPVIGLLGLATIARGFWVSGKPVANKTDASRSGLPEVIAAPLAQVADVVARVRERRHRDSLRAVVQRVLSLREHIPPTQRAAADRDLGRVIELAVVATVRIDDLDAALLAQDLRNPSADARAQMLERDVWAARLLEFTAFLDAQRARYAATTVEAGPDSATELDELRAHIEALEEVQSL